MNLREVTRTATLRAKRRGKGKKVRDLTNADMAEAFKALRWAMGKQFALPRQRGQTYIGTKHVYPSSCYRWVRVAARNENDFIERCINEYKKAR